MKENKKVLLLVGIILFLGLCATRAQSPFATLAANGVPETVLYTKDPTWLRPGSIHQAWFNFGVSTQLRPEAHLNRATRLDGSIVMNILPSAGGLNIAVVTDMALQLQGSADVLRAGVYPWIISSRIKSGGTVLFYGGLCYEIIPEKTLDTSPQRVKALLGVEGVAPMGKQRSPFVMSTKFIYEDELQKKYSGNRNKVHFHIEGYVLVPIMPCIGITATLRDLSEVRAGLVISLPIGKG